MCNLIYTCYLCLEFNVKLQFALDDKRDIEGLRIQARQLYHFSREEFVTR